MCKMVIVQVQGRTHTPVSWATGDTYACAIASRIASGISDPKSEVYWRKATPKEITTLEAQRMASKGKRLPGWG
jgi:hypothetical protein